MFLTKINYFKFDTTDFDILTKLFKKNIFKRESKLSEILNCLFGTTVEKNKVIFRSMGEINATDKKTIINIGLKYLNTYGFVNEPLTNKNYYVELVRYECFKQDNKQLEPLTWHKDDGATTDYNVNTIIFYLNKSTTIQGGDILVNINNKKTLIKIEPEMALTFYGSVLHTPTPCFGEGTRDCVIFQVERSI